MNQRWARLSLRSVGILAVLLGAAGLLYTAESAYRVVTGAIDQTVRESGAPHVYSAFFVMASVCVIFYLLVMFCGIHFLRLQSGLWWLFTTVLATETICYFSIGYWLWPHPKLGLSVAGATGISSGGLIFQFLLLFPLWAPILVYVAHRSERHHAP